MLNHTGYSDLHQISISGLQRADNDWRRHSHDRVSNHLLAALPTESLRLLLGRMERVPLKRRQIIQERNLPTNCAYFLESGAASLMARAGERSTVEIRTLGSKDFVGTSIVLGTRRSPHRCVVQIAGEALRISADDLAHSMDELPELRRVILGYVQTALVHSSQLVACNTRHSLRQRLARWLMIANDGCQTNELALTHDSLSRALGVRRAGVTKAIGELEQEGLIRRGRGRILIIEPEGLEQACCNCYRAIRCEYERALPSVLAAVHRPGGMPLSAQGVANETVP